MTCHATGYEFSCCLHQQRVLRGASERAAIDRDGNDAPRGRRDDYGEHKRKHEFTGEMQHDRIPFAWTDDFCWPD